MTDSTGLMIEGGGMRSAYAAGVLDLFLDQNIEFPAVATTSAGAIISSSFISKQRDRNYEILKAVSSHPQTISFKRLLRQRELFNMDYIFDKIPSEIVPLDFNRISDSNTDFLIGTTDINTGSPVYYDTYETMDDLNTVTRASCSLPALSRSVLYDNHELMDGGISNPILIDSLIDRGYKKNVVILTRNMGYFKRATQLNWLYKKMFKERPMLVKLLFNRHIIYNQTIEKLKKLAAENKIFLIQPDLPLAASRVEKRKIRLKDIYNQGYKDAERKLPALKMFLSGAMGNEKIGVEERLWRRGNLLDLPEESAGFTDYMINQTRF
ncbi:patatin-like phospholipase family protein [Salinicoccus albus]|uniref:patatin-like phospholipase family protein n=1 Tax=Salinicoccus albus TaxID=418756 RepID=UPI00037C3CB8|nr:patatin family protein [Salinicoccus albus]